MTTSDSVSPDAGRNAQNLANRLLQYSAGDWQFEAATRLICEHLYWLSQPDFVDQFIHEAAIGDAPTVGIDWKSLAAYLRSGFFDHPASEVAVLRAAAAFTPYGDPIQLWALFENQTVESIVAIANAGLTVSGYGDLSASIVGGGCVDHAA